MKTNFLFLIVVVIFGTTAIGQTKKTEKYLRKREYVSVPSEKKEITNQKTLDSLNLIKKKKNDEMILAMINGGYDISRMNTSDKKKSSS